MELSVALIRSGITPSGQEGRFLGRIDEPLSADGKMALRWRVAQGVYPGADLVFVSGRSRALGTAGILYPQTPAIVVKGLEPYDYGKLSGKNYGELAVDKQFLAWQASGGELTLPEAEEPQAFAGRCVGAFRKIIRETLQKNLGQVALVTHLSVIKTILQKHHSPRPVFQDWQVEFGGGFLALYNPATGALQVTEKF